MLSELAILYTSGQLLGSQFLGGILGNFTAALVQSVAKWAGKLMLDKIPDLVAQFAQGGSNNNHDLLRMLRRAGCRTATKLGEEILRDDFGLNTINASLMYGGGDIWRR